MLLFLLLAVAITAGTIIIAAVHEKHALVLVNSGGANGEDILLLAQEMSSSIQSQFGIGLVPEVQLI